MKNKACYLLLAAALLLVISCTCTKSKDYAPTLIGKWRSEKPNTEEMIKEVRKETQAKGLPEHVFEPIIDKLKKAKNLTAEWEFKSDQTGSFGQTGLKPLSFTWRVVRKKGSTLVLSMDLMGGQKSLEIVFRDDDQFSMRFMEEVNEYEDPPVVFTRFRE
jgi:hypothetical protein